jgi:hypothetical protein
MVDVQLPEDLLRIQRALDAALAEEAAFRTEVAAGDGGATAVSPRPEVLRGPTRSRDLSAEQRERLHRIRDRIDELVLAKHRHPLMARAIADGDRMTMDNLLQAAAAEGPTVPQT